MSPTSPKLSPKAKPLRLLAGASTTTLQQTSAHALKAYQHLLMESRVRRSHQTEVHVMLESSRDAYNYAALDQQNVAAMTDLAEASYRTLPAD